MNSEKLRYWASLIYIPDTLQLRDAPGSSSHQEEINAIRRISRKHNQLVLFGIDPQPTINHLEVLSVRE